ncbi:thioredoxin domain-containing protein [soil metagenome]
MSLFIAGSNRSLPDKSAFGPYYTRMDINRLGRETSPYLLQHRDNPVHWWPWGTEAFAEAKRTNKPVLLSIGYAACHWCHVMAHESFEDQVTADLMNANFINIKVDREERPDVDRIYMQALHALGEQGGWPLTMFLTPEAHPFWGGTYFPKEALYGRASFKHVLSEIDRIWRTERDKIHINSTALLGELRREAPPQTGQLSNAVLDNAATAFLSACDLVDGGLKGAPKFPQAPFFSFLWTMARRKKDARLQDAVEITLTHMSQGGIYDHLGGGLARYSVDAHWLVPHFEKMLYDNSQFVSLLARAWSATKSDLFRIRIEETVSFVLHDMRTPSGGFAASYDADSEGHEGTYYVWREEEIRAALPPKDALAFIAAYDVTPQGNWEDRTILNRLRRLQLGTPSEEAALAASRKVLLDIRRNRPPPGFDDKVLADWNGLMITALAEAALVLNRPDWAKAASDAFDAVLALLWHGERLHHSWRIRQRRHLATADGYAAMISAALALAAVSPEKDYNLWAEKLLEAFVAHHWNENLGAFYFAAGDAEMLITRTAHGTDDVTPNANSMMVGNLARLHLRTGKAEYRDRAQRIHEAFAEAALSNPFGYASLLNNWLALADPIQITATGEFRDPFAEGSLRAALDVIGPDCIIQYVARTEDLPEDHPAHGKATGDRSLVYLCRGQVCAAPATNPQDITQAINLLGL